jgi:hypothetical protein
MKSPVVPFFDPAAANKQRAKLSQEGSYIPTLINISIIKNNLPSEQQNKSEKGEPEKSWRALIARFKTKCGQRVSVPAHRSGP